MHEVIRVKSLEIRVRTTDVPTHAAFSESPEKWAYLRLQLIAALNLIADELESK